MLALKVMGLENCISLCFDGGGVVCVLRVCVSFSIRIYKGYNALKSFCIYFFTLSVALQISDCKFIIIVNGISSHE